jgi:hypothetical protein
MSSELTLDADTLSVSEEAVTSVTGFASVAVEYEDEEYTVHTTINSYEYTKNGEDRVNHVVNTIIEDEGGAIVKEVDPTDYNDPERAIGSARNATKYVAQYIDEFLD